MKSLNIFWLACLASIAFATEDETENTADVIDAPIEIVLVCPAGSKHQGEEVPEWVTTSSATEFFCNESSDKTEIGE